MGEPSADRSIAAGEDEFEDLKYEGESDSTCASGVEDGSSAVIGDDTTLAEMTQQTPVVGMESSINGEDNSFFGFSRLNYIEGVRSWTNKFNSHSPPICDPPTEQDAQPTMIPSSNGSLSSTDADDTMSGCEDESEVVDSEPTAAIRGVTFNEKVRVLPIPTISAYSLDERFRMFANRFELRENKIRNKKEYAFDGYDWRNATEEGNMAICPLSGDLLHPAHL